jgi:ATP-dependent Lon protease
MIEVPRKLKRQISKITRKAVRTAIKGEKRLGEIVETTATACKLQAENEEKGSKIQKLAAAHTNFYS